MLVSIIVPCYNEEAALPYFLKEIKKTEAELQNAYGCRFELIFINDGSKDNTLSVLRDFAKNDPSVRYLSFSRNFGKEAAMYAGLKHATGGYVALMDADLQHPPSMLSEMYEGLQSGEYDCVAARRMNRNGEPPLRSFSIIATAKAAPSTGSVPLPNSSKSTRLSLSLWSIILRIFLRWEEKVERDCSIDCSSPISA